VYLHVVRCIGVALLLLTTGSLPAQSQVTFVQKYFDAKTGPDSIFYNVPNDYPGSILIHGYLTGKIPGYRFDIGTEVVKRKTVPDNDLPDKWDKQTQYYQEDQVRHNGRYFIAIQEPALATVPENGDNWMEIEILGDPVGERHYFPSLADTLPRSVFPTNVVIAPVWSYEPWVPTDNYYADDAIEYKNVFYRAISLNTGKEPDAHPQLWRKENVDALRFFSNQDISIYKVLYARSVVDGKNVDTPQMITPCRYDQDTGIYKSTGVSFYFQDAVRFLERLKQPLFYQSISGYWLKDLMVASDDERVEVLRLLRSAMTNGSLKIRKDWIADQAGVTEFKAAASLTDWNVIQDLRSKAFHVVRASSGKRVISIPATHVIVLQSKAPTKVLTLAELMEDNFTAQAVDTLNLDSLETIPYNLVLRPPVLNMSFYELYTLSRSSNEVTELWMSLAAAVKAQAIRPTVKPYTHYAWSHTWSDFYYRGMLMPSLDLLPRGNSEMEMNAAVAGSGVIYKKNVSSTGQLTFSPVSIMFSVTHKTPGTDDYFTEHIFSWDDVARWLRSKSATQWNDFITQVDEGSAQFVNAEVILGMIEE
jgi:hypothetical protein